MSLSACSNLLSLAYIVSGAIPFGLLLLAGLGGFKPFWSSGISLIMQAEA